jgi:hypothetical protein
VVALHQVLRMNNNAQFFSLILHGKFRLCRARGKPRRIKL